MNKLAVMCRLETLEQNERWFLNRALCDAFLPLPIVLIPLVECIKVQEIVPLCSGLLLPGGNDALPCYYGEQTDGFSQYYDAPMDLWELTVLDAFVKAKKPVLGICRGMQMIQLYHGGALEAQFDVLHHQQDNLHPIHLSADSALRRLMQDGQMVNSFHHQRIVRLHPCLRVDAVTADGSIEAFHHESLPVYGVQWHPERMRDDRILPYFVSLLSAA